MIVCGLCCCGYKKSGGEVEWKDWRSGVNKGKAGKLAFPSFIGWVTHASQFGISEFTGVARMSRVRDERYLLAA